MRIRDRYRFFFKLSLFWWSSLLHYAVYVPYTQHTAPPLTVENVMRVLGRVRDRRRLGFFLSVPSSTQDDIESNCLTEEEKMAAIIHYWLTLDPTPSWRRLIRALDWEEPDTADGIRHYAEPLTGMYTVCIYHNDLFY